MEPKTREIPVFNDATIKLFIVYFIKGEPRKISTKFFTVGVKIHFGG